MSEQDLPQDITPAPAPEPEAPAPAAEPTPAVEPAAVEPAAPETAVAAETPVTTETPAAAEAPAETSAPATAEGQPRPPRPDRGPRPPKPERGPKPERQGGAGAGPKPEAREPRPDRGPRPGGERGERGERGDRGDRGPRPMGGRPGMGRPEGLSDFDVEKLIADSLYLDNAAHAVVARMRDMDSGTKSQLRRLYSAVRRANRAAESDRQHQFVMLRARIAYTIARHGLRSLDPLERLLLQVTRKNDPRGYERFRDLFEAIVAYNE